MSRATVVFADGSTLASDFQPTPKTVVTGRDFAQSNYCWYLPNVTTLTNATYQIDPMSSTKAAQVPTTGSNPFYLMRLGPNNSTSGVPVTIDGLTLIGTQQPPSAANPAKTGHNYGGLMVYWGRKARITNSKFLTASWGDSNSPPGETFAVNGYHCTDTYISNVEVDGRLPDGTRVGGSPIGFNHSTRPVVEDCYLHHSLVSSLTFSTAGTTPSAANVTDSPTTRRVRIEHNANTKMEKGYRFTGMNHEHVIGTITHELPKIAIDWSEWTAAHMWFGSWMPPAKVVITIDPDEISGGPARHNGALTLAVPATVNGKANTHQLANFDVRDHTGKALIPYIISAPPSGALPISKTTHYVINTG